jgi:hypothetical protein
VSIRSLIAGLAASGSRFVVVGMAAGQIYGSRYATEDLDVVYDTSAANVDLLYRYLTAVDAYIKETWPTEGLARELQRRDLVREKSLTLGTREGELDVLHRIDGVGDFSAVLAASTPLRLEGMNGVRIISLPALIASKRASGREKDKLHVPELEAILELRKRADPDAHQP